MLCAVGINDPEDPLILKQDGNRAFVLHDLKRGGRLKTARWPDRQAEPIRIVCRIDRLKPFGAIGRERNRFSPRQRATQIGGIGPLPDTVKIRTPLLCRQWQRCKRDDGRNPQKRFH